jgi:SAM-dependent methyltransferase
MFRDHWRVAASICGLSAVFLACGCQADRGAPTSASLAAPVVSPPAAADTPEAARAPDVLYVPTPEPVVERMLELANVGPSDVVYDLGCGDGRIVVMAAQRYGARAVGFDIDPARVAEARRNVAAAGIEQLVRIEQRDIFELDLSPASVVTLYLLPELNVRLLPQLERLKPGTRIVSHDFDIAGVAPKRELSLRPDPRGPSHSVYFFELPLQKTQ